MKVALVTNINGKGLQIDAELLKGWFEARGHSAELVQFNAPWKGNADLGIMLEVVEPFFFPQAPRWWWFPNLEWTTPEMLPHAPKFEWVLAKTRDAERVLSARWPNVRYTGFLTRDRYDASVERLPKFLHLGGESAFKNTSAVISAWREWRYYDGSDIDAELTVVSNTPLVECPPTPSVTYIKRATDEEIKHLQNSHLFHLLPSAYEGWGHALHEAQSVRAVITTTDAEPMDEVEAAYVISVERTRQVNLATLHEIGGRLVRQSVKEALERYAKCLYWSNTRKHFERGQQEFSQKFSELLKAEGARRVVVAKSLIALLGNFDPPHSTENDLKWTLNDMGYEVIALQENRTTTDEVLERCSDVKLFLWVHTHGWTTPGTLPLSEMVGRLRAQGVRTASFHLDRYRGLNQLDGREDNVGRHPWWLTDRVFTADGGSESARFFADRGVAHTWLPPGVVAHDCHPGTFRKDLAAKVGFVGSPGYHPEYPFRAKLVAWLKETYGSDFRLYQGFRGEALNDVYASCEVLVGDSCFAGSDRYWSDRVPETLGRGGFLIAPATEGLRIPGLVTFEAGNLDDLKFRIDYYLKWPEERDWLRRCAHVWVRNNETYTQRMQTLLQVMEVE